MRIGIDATCLPAALAGAGRYIHGMVRGLAEIDHENEYFIFLKRHDSSPFENLPANMHLVRLPDFPRPLRLAWQHTLAGAQARALRLDVWHGPHYTLPNFNRNLASVVTFHDLGVFNHPQFYPAGKRLYFRYAMTQALRCADHVVTVSKATARDLQVLCRQRGLSGKAGEPKVTAIHSGVESKFFDRIAPAELRRVRERYRLHSPYLLFVSTFEKRKNLAMLVQAFRSFCDRQQSGHLLVLAGQHDNGTSDMQAAVAKYGMQDRVRPLGYVAEADLLALYQATDLFVLPSLYEGFGFPLLEAMASGAVVLAADNSSLRELAGHPALLSETTPTALAEKMNRLLCNLELRHSLIGYGIRRAQQFSWRKTAEQLLEVYTSHRPAKLHPRRNGKVDFVPAQLAKNGHVHPEPRLAAGQSGDVIASAIKRTLAYADLFDYPLTADEIRQGLAGARASEVEVRYALEKMRVCGELEVAESYFFLPGRGHLVEVRQRRRDCSLEVLANHAGLLRLIQNFPFVRGAALSGTLAFENCKPGDDVDLFLIVERGRLWTVYFALAALLKLRGKRRQICLNCFVSTEALEIDDRDFFVAHQIVALKPLVGAEAFRQFFRANAWCAQYLPQFDPDLRLPAQVYEHDLRQQKSFWRKVVEVVFGLQPFDLFESLIFHLYQKRIHRATRRLPAQAVVVNRGQIKLFTNNHRFRLQRRLDERLQALEEQVLVTAE